MRWAWSQDYHNRPSATQLKETLSQLSVSHLVNAYPLQPFLSPKVLRKGKRKRRRGGERRREEREGREGRGETEGWEGEKEEREGREGRQCPILYRIHLHVAVKA